jgi:sulfofructose kinase
VGDDAYAELHRREMEREKIGSHWIETPNCPSQSSFILLDKSSGERTILWKRDPRLELKPEDLRRDWITHGRLLHVDGHDCPAATAAARWARDAGILVIADLDNCYPGVEALLEVVDYIISSRDFPARLTGESDLLRSLPMLQQRFKCKVAAATLGADGVIAWGGAQFHYCPTFAIRPVDTTGAGDIFHAAFAYSLFAYSLNVQSPAKTWHLAKALEFSCAAAALSCMAIGARGGIASLGQIAEIMRTGALGPGAYTSEQLSSARAAVVSFAAGAAGVSPAVAPEDRR